MESAGLNKDKQAFYRGISQSLSWEETFISISWQNPAAESLSRRNQKPKTKQQTNKNKDLVFVVMLGNGGTGRKASHQVVQKSRNYDNASCVLASQRSVYSSLKWGFPTRSPSVLTAFDPQGGACSPGYPNGFAFRSFSMWLPWCLSRVLSKGSESTLFQRHKKEPKKQRGSSLTWYHGELDTYHHSSQMESLPSSYWFSGLTCLGSSSPEGWVPESATCGTRIYSTPVLWSGSSVKCQNKPTGGSNHSVSLPFALAGILCHFTTTKTLICQCHQIITIQPYSITARSGICWKSLLFYLAPSLLCL